MTEQEKQNEYDAPRRAADKAAELRRWRVMVLGILTVAALFSGAVLGVMLWAGVAQARMQPPAQPGEVSVGVDSVTLQRLRSLMQKYPESEELKEAIRAEDRRVRHVYFARRRAIGAGAWLLVAGLGTVLLCLKAYFSLDASRPEPGDAKERTDPQRWWGARRRMMGGVALIAVLLVGALVTMIAIGGPHLPAPAAERAPGDRAAAPQENVLRQEEEAEEAVAADPDADAYEENWPRFRGSSGVGVVEAGDWPTEWDGASGKNVVWKSEVPAPGNSSPVIWGGRIFLTAGTEQKREVLCFARSDGRLLWRTEVPTPPDFDPSEIYLMDPTGYASSTPATDGKRVYAFFATADLAAVDFQGNLVWNKHLGDPNNTYGIATSPIVHDGKVVLQFDRGTMPEDELSALLAFDPTTGEEVWNVQRPVVNSWTTPVVAETETGQELITCADPWVISYDPEMGTELWRAEVLSGDVAPSPVVAGNVAYVTNEYAKVAAIGTGGVGDVTDTKVLWTARDGMSDAPSPICDGRLFLQLHSAGRITCYGAEEGNLVWDEQIDSQFWASPTLVGGTVYLPAAGAEGKVYLFELADSFEVASTQNLGEPILASPAFADSQIYIRGEKHLFCIGSN